MICKNRSAHGFNTWALKLKVKTYATALKESCKIIVVFNNQWALLNFNLRYCKWLTQTMKYMISNSNIYYLYLQTTLHVDENVFY